MRLFKRRPSIIAIIGARGGSKGIPNKNIKLLAGKSLIGFSIETALQSKFINRCVVSTDSIEIARVAHDFGAETPCLRNVSIANDDSLDIDYIKHMLYYLEDIEHRVYDYVVLLPPTTPFREKEVIEEAFKRFLYQSDKYTGLMSVTLSSVPYKMIRVYDGEVNPIMYIEPSVESWTRPRQSFPEDTFMPNGYIDIISVKNIFRNNSLYGNRILTYITPKTVDIDTEDDWQYAEYLINKKNNSPSGK